MSKEFEIDCKKKGTVNLYTDVALYTYEIFYDKYSATEKCLYIEIIFAKKLLMNY